MNETIQSICAAANAPHLQQALAAALQTGSPDEWGSLAAACASAPEAADALCRAGMKARELRHAAHERLLAAALSLSPYHVEATLAMARSYMGRELNRQAQKLLADLRKHRASHNAPEHAELDELLLRSSQATGMQEDARAAAYRLSINADAPWNALLQTAEFFKAENDLDAQRTLFTRMITQRPDDPDANLLMASWLHDEGYDEEARVHIERAVKHAAHRAQRVRAQRLLFELCFPDDDAEFRKLTQSFFAVPAEDSLPMLARITRRHPDLAEAWLFYGFALRRERRLDEAMRAYERCARLSDDPNAHKELAAVYGELNEPKLAERSARRALSLLGDHDRVSWVNLAAALAELGRTSEAGEALERARNLDPASPLLQSVQELINAREKPRRGFYNARLVRL